MMTLYGCFAIIATISNLLTQRLVMLFGDSESEYVTAVLAGTFVGLCVKYLMDKRWVFSDREGGVINHGRKFALYSIMGVLTTLIFWASETFFWFVFQTHSMREFGAVIGLTIGYIVKFNLDIHFVFKGKSEGGAR